jgi:uncharacterized protein YycO
LCSVVVAGVAFNHNAGLFIVTKFSELREGDIVFQISKSQQSPYIMKATNSIFTHCGIVTIKDNISYVLEASRETRLIPLKNWKRNGKFKFCIAKRIVRGDLNKIKYNSFLGTKYDISFKFNNDKYYCSELVYLIYKNQYGIKIGEPKPVSDYNIKNLTEVLKKRGISTKQLAISPADIMWHR